MRLTDPGQNLNSINANSVTVQNKELCQPRNRRVVAEVRRRDNNTCCLTGRTSSFRDALVVVPILPAQLDLRLPAAHDLLEAFLTPELKGWLLSDERKAAQGGHENHWLLCRSAASAFAQGYFKLSFRKKFKVIDELRELRVQRADIVSQYEVETNTIGGPRCPEVVRQAEAFRRASLVDHSSSGTPIPSQQSLEIVSSFSSPIRWLCVSQETAEREKRLFPQSRASSLASLPRTALSLLSRVCIAWISGVWRNVVPDTMRVRAYRGLAFLGSRLYGPSDSLNVQQLPFGLYLKAASAARRQAVVNEHAALELVRRHTKLPVPQPLDLVSDPGGGDTYLLTTRIPGYKLGWCIDSMSDRAARALTHDLRRHLSAVRGIPCPYDTSISNAAGGPCFDHRINAALGIDDEGEEGAVGPFGSEAEFNDVLRCGALPEVVHRDGHGVEFTHGDLNMRNILVDENGVLAGIVDWENAGWFPEYWDYTKAYFVTKLNRRWLGMVDDVFHEFGDYSKELGVEQELWYYCF